MSNHGPGNSAGGAVSQLLSSRELHADLRKSAGITAAQLVNIYSNLTFIAVVDPISPDFDEQDPLKMKPGNWWLPPTKKKAYDTNESYRFLWHAGSMKYLEEKSPLGRIDETKLSVYRSSTIFTQRQDTPHLLAVSFDAREKSVCKQQHGWTNISFRYKPAAGGARTYAYLTVLGQERQLAASGPEFQIPQLLPHIYNYEAKYDHHQKIVSPGTSHAGLIGELTLLLALAVFSAPIGRERQVLVNCVKPKMWRPHEFGYPAGRK